MREEIHGSENNSTEVSIADMLNIAISSADSVVANLNEAFCCVSTLDESKSGK